MLTMYCIWQGIQQVLLPAQVDAIDPTNKVANLAFLSAIGSALGSISIVLGGAISDRTRSRFGRRAPWIALMGLLAAGSCIVMGWMNTMLGLSIAVACLWTTLNWYQGIIYAIIPDRVPERLRGTASSLIGMALPLGILIGVNVVARTTREMGYLIIALAFVVATIVLLVGAPDSPEYTVEREKPLEGSPIMRFFKQFSSFRDKDFSLVFFSRIAFFFAVFGVMGYQYYIITDYLNPSDLPVADPAVAVSIVATVSTVSQVIAVLLVGPLADKFDRRKLAVGLSAIGQAVGFFLPLVFPSWWAMVAYAVIAGSAGGIYFAVDLALMSLVLPSKGDEGRDLGIFAVATSVPSAFAPVVAALLITATGTYASVFIFGIAMAVTGGLLVFGVKKIR
jgi:MFS family permease